jgi:hypothetical protein
VNLIPPVPTPMFSLTLKANMCPAPTRLPPSAARTPPTNAASSPTDHRHCCRPAPLDRPQPPSTPIVVTAADRFAAAVASSPARPPMTTPTSTNGSSSLTLLPSSALVSSTRATPRLEFLNSGRSFAGHHCPDLHRRRTPILQPPPPLSGDPSPLSIAFILV